MLKLCGIRAGFPLFARIFADSEKRLPNARNCAILNKLFYGQRVETYRSGHNGTDSKSCGELSVSSTKNLVTMRVLPGSKIE